MTDGIPLSDLLPARPRPTVLVTWGLLACLNLSAGLVIASWPERQTDLETIRWRGHQWLMLGSNIYSHSEDASDYPPHAVVTLSPLGLLPAAWAVPIWASANLGLAVAAPYLTLHAVRPAAPIAALVLPILMFLCWGGFRTLLQFNLLALVFGVLAMAVADRRPIWSGLCLGMALMKPQIAALLPVGGAHAATACSGARPGGGGSRLRGVLSTGPRQSVDCCSPLSRNPANVLHGRAHHGWALTDAAAHRPWHLEHGSR
jgi:hypothetical protein